MIGAAIIFIWSTHSQHQLISFLNFNGNYTEFEKFVKDREFFSPEELNNYFKNRESMNLEFSKLANESGKKVIQAVKPNQKDEKKKEN